MPRKRIMHKCLYTGISGYFDVINGKSYFVYRLAKTIKEELIVSLDKNKKEHCLYSPDNAPY